MTRPNIVITDSQTKEILVHEMNDEEYSQFLIDQEKIKARDEANAVGLEE